MNRIIVITGASAGIGAELARLVARHGDKPVLAARRRTELEAVARECGPDALIVVTDVTVRADVEKLRDAALARFGHIDVWVNNAGRGITRSVAELTDDDLDSMWRDNVKSAVYGMQAVLPHFKERKAGQIINISSGLSRLPYASIRAAYSGAKAALNAISANLRVELKNTFPAIQVTVVMPGVVATDFGKNALGGGPDSRHMPGAQRVEDTAQIILDAIDTPRPEIYGTPGMQADVERYYKDVGAFEMELANRFRR